MHEENQERAMVGSAVAASLSNCQILGTPVSNACTTTEKQ